MGRTRLFNNERFADARREISLAINEKNKALDTINREIESTSATLDRIKDEENAAIKDFDESRFDELISKKTFTQKRLEFLEDKQKHFKGVRSADETIQFHAGVIAEYREIDKELRKRAAASLTELLNVCNEMEQAEKVAQDLCQMWVESIGRLPEDKQYDYRIGGIYNNSSPLVPLGRELKASRPALKVINTN